jgi:branched-chain amino acid transport system permease protein
VSETLRARFGGLAPSLAPAAVTAGVLALLPLFTSSTYDYSVLTNFCINLLILTGLNLISGYGQQLSLGQAALYGAGAYTVTVGSIRFGLDPALCFFLAPVVSAIFAVVVGVPSLRLRGLYFAMATLGVGVVFQLYLDRAIDVTGGPNGVAVAPIVFAGIDLGQPSTMYAVAAVFAFAGLIVAQLFLAWRIGWGLRAAAASEPAASVVGVNIFLVRLVALALSGAYAGLAGALQAFNSLYVSPTSFAFFTSVLFVFVLTIGGLGTWAGPLVGATVLLVFDKWLTSFSDKEPLILAGVFIICLRLFPRGVARRAADLVGIALSRRHAPVSSANAPVAVGGGDSA